MWQQVVHGDVSVGVDEQRLCFEDVKAFPFEIRVGQLGATVSVQQIVETVGRSPPLLGVGFEEAAKGLPLFFKYLKLQHLGGAAHRKWNDLAHLFLIAHTKAYSGEGRRQGNLQVG